MLAFLLVFNAFASVCASLVWRFAAKFTRNFSARIRAQIIFTLRIFPIVSALIFIAAFLLPSYLFFEPAASNEIVSFRLALFALASAVGVGIALFRVFKTWRKTRALVKNWMRLAEPIDVANVAIPVYALEHPFPVIAVVGILQPRMFVARKIFESLSDEEFQAAIAHEYGHLLSQDNFKRTILRICSDLLILPFGKSLDAAWSEHAESAADEYAAQFGGNLMAVNLASALIKIARIIPNGTSPSMPLAAFLISEESALVTRRVKRLLQITESKDLVGYSKNNYLFWLTYALMFSIIALLATNHSILFSIHNVIEGIVALFQ